jgi:hypothetical protein
MTISGVALNFERSVSHASESGNFPDRVAEQFLASTPAIEARSAGSKLKGVSLERLAPLVARCGGQFRFPYRTQPDSRCSVRSFKLQGVVSYISGHLHIHIRGRP